uniref:Uncharacterized protein n=1 Tax=Clytia hemisphaerica TaxID=252671 RepID=A0A7M5XA25_9CNID
YIGHNKPLGIPPNDHGIQPQIYHKEVIRPMKGQIFQTIDVLSPEWSLEFQFRAYDRFDRWGGLFDFKGPSIDKNPRVLLFQTPETGQTRMRIISSVSGNSLHAVEFTIGNMNETNSVKIQQRYISNGQYLYSVFLNGKEKHSTLNTMAKQDYNVKMYFSDGLHKPAQIDVWNLKHTNF